MGVGSHNVGVGSHNVGVGSHGEPQKGCDESWRVAMWVWRVMASRNKGVSSHSEWLWLCIQQHPTTGYRVHNHTIPCCGMLLNTQPHHTLLLDVVKYTTTPYLVAGCCCTHNHIVPCCWMLLDVVVHTATLSLLLGVVGYTTTMYTVVGCCWIHNHTIPYCWMLLDEHDYWMFTFCRSSGTIFCHTGSAASGFIFPELGNAGLLHIVVSSFHMTLCIV